VDDEQPELGELTGLIEGSGLPEEPRQAALACLRPLPRLYAELLRTYESRHEAEILRQARWLVKTLAFLGSPAADRLSVAVADRLRALHARLGLPELRLALPPPPKSKSKARKPR
jgi:hypothetical protein